MADASELQKIVESKMKEINDLVHRRMPVLVGSLAKRHFQENFAKSGFVNNGLQPWTKSKRQSGTGTNALYKTLLSGHNHLYSSIQYKPGDGSVLIINPVPYAIVHNEGYEGTQSVKAHKRSLSSLALKSSKKGKASSGNVKGFTRKMNIPKRQFIGESAELNKKIEDKWDSEITKIIK